MMTRNEAHNLASACQIPLNDQFHALNHDTVERIIAAADFVKYRQPKNANGSRARYFHAYMVRSANSERGV